ncbi:18.1 kDa class I heat shock protein-like [Durio zibethinus]|uniref:18.1 kDa class I heat shock protein-like n=1 Tax=Durio zibethinus TaxID=66656 RepID=A0A6P5ZTS1_DURZI|nr:18.1 kDa class I heat shock protein-like [Durio zibethinus]
MSLIPIFFVNRQGNNSDSFSADVWSNRQGNGNNFDSFSADVWSNRQGNNFDSFSVDVWDPFKDFPSLSQKNSDFVYARVDWKETPEAHVFTIYYLDMTKEEVKVEIEDNRVLHISGERNVEKDKNDTRLVMKRRSGKFSRRFSFMEKVKMDQVKASMEKGDLTVTVPKVEVEKPNFKTIHHSYV